MTVRVERPTAESVSQYKNALGIMHNEDFFLEIFMMWLLSIPIFIVGFLILWIGFFSFSASFKVVFVIYSVLFVATAYYYSYYWHIYRVICPYCQRELKVDDPWTCACGYYNSTATGRVRSFLLGCAKCRKPACAVRCHCGSIILVSSGSLKQSAQEVSACCARLGRSSSSSTGPLDQMAILDVELDDILGEDAVGSGRDREFYRRRREAKARGRNKGK